MSLATLRRPQRHAIRFAVLLIAIAGSERAALAQSASGMAGTAIQADPQIVNAAQAAEEALKAAATNGEATRGASGAIASLLTSSDTLICSAWIVSFRTRYRNMVIEGADAQTLRAMQDLMEKVEAACDRILNPEAHQAGAVGGGGQRVEPEEDEAEDEVEAIYPHCPQCDPLKRALDRATYRHQTAQYELNQAMRHTDFLEAAYASGASPEDIRAATGGETVEESESFEARKRAEVSNTRRAMEAARARLVECLERCHAATLEEQHSFLDNRTTQYALAGGAAAGALVLVTSGGSDEATPVDTVSAPSPASTPPPTGAATSPNTGVAACAGTYAASFNVSSDPGGHDRFVRMPRNMNLEVGIASIHVRGSAPFVEVNGTIDSSGNFHATGMGTVAGFDGVTVRMDGTLRRCGDGSGELSAQYGMGVGGELPGGQPITFAVSATK